MLIYVWRAQVRQAAESMRHRSDAAQLADVLRRKARNRAIGKLKTCFAKVMRGETGMRIYIWRVGVKATREAISSGMSNKLAKRLKQQALNKLKDTMARIMRGQIGFVIYMWTSLMRRDFAEWKARAEAIELEQKIRIEAAKGNRNQALRKLQMIFARITRGEIGVRLYIWQSTAKAAKEAELKNKLVTKVKARGLNKLKDTMARIMRGYMGMLIHVWNSEMVKSLEMTRQCNEAAALEAKIRNQVQSHQTALHRYKN